MSHCHSQFCLGSRCLTISKTKHTQRPHTLAHHLTNPVLTTQQSIQVLDVATHTVRNTHTHWDNLPWTPRLALFLPTQIYPHFITHSPCQHSLTIRHSYVSSLKLFYHSLRPPGIPIHKPKFVLPNSQNPPEHSGMSQESHPGTVQIIQHLSTHTQASIISFICAGPGKSKHK